MALDYGNYSGEFRTATTEGEKKNVNNKYKISELIEQYKTIKADNINEKLDDIIKDITAVEELLPDINYKSASINGKIKQRTEYLEKIKTAIIANNLFAN